MAGAGVDKVRHAKLADASQSLEEGRIQKDGFPGEKLDDSPDWVVERFRIRSVAVRSV